MRIDFLTLFPEMCEAFLSESILGRARKKQILQVQCHNIRDYAFDKHKRVDDTPYGGGMGMLMLAEPIAQCFEAVCSAAGQRPHFVYMSPQGAVLSQRKVEQLAQCESLAILCGHYEGVDERVLEELVDEQISVGDYVLTGGELPGLILADAVSRLVPGVLSSSECFEEESHYRGLLEHPQYTKPAVWRGRAVPEVLLSGHHANIKKWKQEESLRRTLQRRPDLLEKAALSDEERRVLEGLRG